MVVSQRPLTLGEILDHTVQLYRRNFVLFAGIAALPAAAIVLGFGGLGLLLNSEIGAFKGGQGTVLITLTVTLLFLVGVPLLLAIFAVALSASSHAVVRAHEGEKVTIRAAYAYGFRHLWRHLWLLVLQGLLAGVIPYAVFTGVVILGAALVAIAQKSGMGSFFGPVLGVLMVLCVIALFVAAVWIWVRYSLAFPASVTEDKSAWAAMKRSAVLSKGTRGRIFVMFLLVGALSTLVSLVFMVPLIVILTLLTQKSWSGSTPSASFMLMFYVVNFGISFFVRAAVIPIYATALQIFYFDQRTRQEGYDIEMLMAQAGWGELPPPVAVVEEAIVAVPTRVVPVLDAPEEAKPEALPE